MPEIINDKKTFSLLEVAKSVQKTIGDRYTSAFWVKAEMNKLNFYRQSGHCYPELVEKQNGKVVAQLKANLWKNDYAAINARFLEVLNEPLKDGIKILFLATIAFDPSYGLSITIHDIDPSFTLGDLEAEKQETLKKLRLEGVFNLNKSLHIPLLPQRIAVISVDTSKGYADFVSVLDGNAWGYKFFLMLFPSVLQGEKAVSGIIAQLRKIAKVAAHFDAVAIVRGGGGDIGLSCYNHYLLAKEIAAFPLPILTGIGHATNETVSEMISHTNAITPTKLAEYLLQKFHNFSVPVREAEKTIAEKSRKLLEDEKTRLQSEAKMFKTLAANMLVQNANSIKNLSIGLARQAVFVFKNEKERLFSLKAGMAKGAGYLLKTQQADRLRLTEKLKEKMQTNFKSRHSVLESLEKNIANMDPKKVLKRGYSITLLNGKALTESTAAALGDTITTVLFEGNIVSRVESTDKTENNKTENQ